MTDSEIKCATCGEAGHDARAHREVEGALSVARAKLAAARAQAPGELLGPLTAAEKWLNEAAALMRRAVLQAKFEAKRSQKVHGRHGGGRISKAKRQKNDKTQTGLTGPKPGNRRATPLRNGGGSGRLDSQPATDCKPGSKRTRSGRKRR